MRSQNRHYAARERARKTHVLSARYPGWKCKKPWRDYSRILMNEPGWWVREFMTQPARIRANQLCTLIVKGRDPDGVLWPSHKRPHLYYW